MASTGLKSLDQVINGLQMGDNVVWQIDDIKDYQDFVLPFAGMARKENKKIVYVRFANHKPLLQENKNVLVYKLDAYGGFESFSTKLNHIITLQGQGAYYVFDCLSDLLSAWSNDLMIGNFFKITCPYLYELNTIAYFAILRNNHSFKTIARIREITQLLIDVYNYKGNSYIHPLKVWNRYSPTMFLPHIKKKDEFVPIANSADTAKLFSSIFTKGAKSTRQNLDYWDRLFLEAEDLAGKLKSTQKKQEMVEKLCRIMIARDEKALNFAIKHFTLPDLLDIKSRMVGTGFIGGKSTGMLLSRNILIKDKTYDFSKLFEPHDSFYIGSDVFYSYIVENGWWKLRMEQKTKEGYFEVAAELKEKMLRGVFPAEIKEQFQQMIEYFGQSPIIVRSSSFLEDGFGNAFAGKYESIFCVNQGNPAERYAKFSEAVRRIYASTMNKDALAYRLQRGLDQSDEQMALLVQRVSGVYRKQYFFPDIAGVGISYNTFVWKNTLDPRAGMLRLVVGLGTRAVNRVEGDYPRIAALDLPLLKVHADSQDAQRFSQHEVDILNIKENRFQTIAANKLLAENLNINTELLGALDYESMRRMKDMGFEEKDIWILNFDKLLSETNFKDVMQKILKILEGRYKYPVEIEFTVNLKSDRGFQINLLQCRTIQTRGLGKKISIPDQIQAGQLIFSSVGNFLGGNTTQPIKKIIYVAPKNYTLLGESAKYDIARSIGELNRMIISREETPVLLIGPGRWGTTTPSLGVPVSFSEINNIVAIAEVAFEEANLMPELSYGTHFFHDLIETNISYVALFPGKEKSYLNQPLLDKMPNALEQMLPQAKKYKNVIKVWDLGERKAKILSDILSQRIVCLLDSAE